MNKRENNVCANVLAIPESINHIHHHIYQPKDF